MWYWSGYGPSAWGRPAGATETPAAFGVPAKSSGTTPVNTAGRDTSSRHPTRQLVGVVATLAGLVGGGVGAGGVALFDRPAPAITPPAAVVPAPVNGSDLPALLAKILPGVVSIQTRLGDGGRGAGTGMLLSARGEVLTNAHVVAGASAITVTRYGTTRSLAAHLVGASPSDDLALIQIDGARDLPAVRLGSSARVAVGTAVVAVGNALGLSAGSPTATEGIISAEGRSVTTDQGGRSLTLEGLFQTDAAINPGNSGGPLFDTTGAVIGINTAVASSAQGIGFAIPIDHAKALLGQLRQGGTAPAPATYLGIDAVRLTPSLRDAYGLTPDAGVVVTQVLPGSPAERSGLAPGDVIVAIDGTSISDTVELRHAVQAAKVGQRLHLQVVRGATTTSVTVTLGAASP